MTQEVLARNFATTSENRIHSDEVARQYGLQGGLVPGVTVYGYMVSEQLLQCGPLQVRFRKPVFEGDLLTIGSGSQAITALRRDEVCAVVTLGGPELDIAAVECPLPPRDRRPQPHLDLAGTVLGTLHQALESQAASPGIPEALLSLANESLMRNFELGPWMHVSSEVSHRGPVRFGDPVQVFATIRECFEKRGREFLVAEIRIESEGRLVQQIRHTAIYKLPLESRPS